MNEPASSDAQAESRAVERARAGDEDAFRELTDPCVRELQVHCYRMLGSVQDAEDLTQETLLAAWRGISGFEGRSSIRSWLYRIATNRCLNALRARRPRGLSTAPWSDQQPPSPTHYTEPLFLDPYPDSLLDGVADTAPGPEARYELREAVGLAFVSGLHRLPARQRAVLVLRDVLGFPAREVAELLGSSIVAVNSALQRARETLERTLPPGGLEQAPPPSSRRERDLIGHYADAFERGDVDAIVALVTNDGWMTMPPWPMAYQGHRAIAGFLATVPAGGHLDRFRLVPTRANGQPAFGQYLTDSGPAQPAVLQVLTVEGDRISAITIFHDLSLFPRFGLPTTLPTSRTRPER